MKKLDQYISESLKLDVEFIMNNIKLIDGNPKETFDFLCNIVSNHKYNISEDDAIRLFNELNRVGIKIKITKKAELFNLKYLLTYLLYPISRGKIVDLNFIDISKMIDISSLFNTTDTKCDIDVSSWDVSKVKFFDKLFCHFGGNIIGLENWNMSSAVSLSGMFEDATKFNADLSKWNVSNVKDMRNMFNGSCVGKLPDWYNK